MRHGREVGAVCLDHESVCWNGRHDLANEFGVFEGDDACERNEVAEREDFVGLVWRVAEAVKDAA
jgi:hypothetical protein